MTTRINKTMAALLLAIAAISMGADNDSLAPRFAPSPSLAVTTPPATTRSSASIVATAHRSWLPVLAVPVAPSKPHTPAPIKEPAAGGKPPPLITSALPAPGLPQFVQGPRLLVTPLPAMMPRIPNLLVTPRKAAQFSPNPTITPAAAVMTPPVNNLDGTAILPALAPFTRDIQIEIAPLPSPLPFDREPYQQSPVAPDDVDPPAKSADAPGRPVMK